MLYEHYYYKFHICGSLPFSVFFKQEKFIEIKIFFNENMKNKWREKVVLNVI